MRIPCGSSLEWRENVRIKKECKLLIMNRSMIKMLGKEIISQAVQEFISASKPDPAIETIEGRTYYEFFENGLGLQFDDGNRLISIQLFSEGLDSYREYSEPFENGMSFEMSKGDIKKLLGRPTNTGGGENIPVLGPRLPWVLFVYEDHALHIQFSIERDSIQLITLMSLDALPDGVNHANDHSV